MKIEKLSPAFKDYLWGGTKLRDVYGKKCDYEKDCGELGAFYAPGGPERDRRR